MGRILVGCALMFVVLQGGLNLLFPRLDLTWSSLIVTAVMLAVAVAIERIGFDRTPREAWSALGFGRPRPSALRRGRAHRVGDARVLPDLLSGDRHAFSLRSDWLWVLVGAIALNGIAEETLFRGFVFGHLRQGGLSFRRAGLISMLIFGAVHLYLFTSNPFIVALLATLLALAAAFPFAFLFERAGMVIWAGVIVHVAAHAYRLLDMPESQALTVASAWILVQFGVVFLVFAFRGNLLRPEPPDIR